MIKLSLESKNFSFYMLSSIISKGIPFLALPVISRMVSPTEYGIWSLYASALIILAPFVSLMGQYNIASDFFKRNELERSRAWGNSLLISFLMGCLIFLLISIFGQYVKTQTSFSDHAIAAMPLILFLYYFRDSEMQNLRLYKNAKVFGIYEVGLSLLTYALIFTYLNRGLVSHQAFVYSILMATLLFFIINVSTSLFKKQISFRPNLKIIKDLYSMGIPMIPHAIGTGLITFADRYILKEEIGLENVGIYSMAYTIGMGIQLITNSFNRTWGPTVYEGMSEGRSKLPDLINKMKKYFKALLLVSILAYLSGFVFMKFFIDIKYLMGIEILHWIVLAYTIQGFYFCFFPFLIHLKKSKSLSIITIVSASINIVLTIYLARFYGIAGAGMATLASMTFSFLAVYFITNKELNFTWRST